MNPKPPRNYLFDRIERLPVPEPIMTIGIGVLCSSQPRPHPIRPDCLILVADTMGSTETDSTSELHKIAVEKDENLFFACAGDLALCNDVGSLIKQDLPKVPQRTHGHIWQLISKCVHEALMARFQWDVLNPKYVFAPGVMFESQRDNVTGEWQAYHPPLQMLVCTFHEQGIPLLYLVDRSWDGDNFAWVHLCQYPGMMAIGAGSYNANFWLKFRSQHLGLSPRQSGYHAYEAKVMASNAPTVNRNTEIVVAFKDRHYILTDEIPEREGCPFSLAELRSLYPKHGPQDTNELGHKSQPVSVIPKKGVRR